MSRPAAFPEPTEPLAETSRATKTETSHTLKVIVDVGNRTVKLSDGSLRIKNGDTVIWNVNGVSSPDKLVIQFAGTVLTSRHTGNAGGPVSVDVTEEKIVGEFLSEPYSVLLDKGGRGTNLIPLAFAGSTVDLTDDGPTLVVDDMGKPPGTQPPPWDGGGPDRQRHARYGRRSQ